MLSVYKNQYVLIRKKYNSLYLLTMGFAYYKYVCVIMMMHIKETASATDQIITGV